MGSNSQTRLPPVLLLLLLVVPTTSHSSACGALHTLPDYAAKCSYVSTDPTCRGAGRIDYLRLFYCSCAHRPAVGYALLLFCLLLLFYLLATTAARYFCPSLEGLARLLRLSPALAGVTLLSLGNGAPDVFSGVVSFTHAATQDVGFNGILGGALFVSTVVTGVVCLSIRSASVDKSSFIRDVSFFLVTASTLCLVIFIGSINLWGALAFLCIYIVYALFVSMVHLRGHELVDVESLLLEQQGPTKEAYPNHTSDAFERFWRVMWFLELPLHLPRRLTVPDIREESWCKPFAVTSVTVSPIFLAFLWNSQQSKRIVYLVGGMLGLAFGTFAALTTTGSSPPKRFQLAWLGGGFVMSVAWSYVTAEELVTLLTSMGAISGVNPSILGLTVLAWGNSLGDLIANVALAWNGGSEGVQVAISGCFAGTMFNTLVGLGLSLVLAAWRHHPSPYVIPEDPTLFQTLGFLVGGLMWSLVMLPARGMKIDRTIGVGLLLIYLCFLCVRIALTLERS